jgi:hypothetical protein
VACSGVTRDALVAMSGVTSGALVATSGARSGAEVAKPQKRSNSAHASITRGPLRRRTRWASFFSEALSLSVVAAPGIGVMGVAFDVP